ncbi:hypothetical protein MSG28_005638 [Choristoneura fumiferana]|uniref:Uncharacterized protein n=1 Tax=Choristoneura fumiferana TaxID=7141 RepID=A0ACC0L027_CHOFU|nr:hypothetical protein MSG28_005638 [Choristoneura fumiferana]
MGKVKTQGLVSDLMPNIKLMQMVGHFLFNYTDGWITITFFGESVRLIADKESNDTLTEPAPRLPLKTWYPFNAMSGTMYIVAFVYQIYWLIFSMAIANLMDVMFCSWLIFACEQLQHLKAIMKPLMELSASLDTYRPNTSELFRASSTEKSEKVPDPVDMDIRGYTRRSKTLA